MARVDLVECRRLAKRQVALGGLLRVSSRQLSLEGCALEGCALEGCVLPGVVGGQRKKGVMGGGGASEKNQFQRLAAPRPQTLTPHAAQPF